MWTRRQDASMLWNSSSCLVSSGEGQKKMKQLFAPRSINTCGQKQWKSDRLSEAVEHSHKEMLSELCIVCLGSLCIALQFLKCSNFWPRNHVVVLSRRASNQRQSARNPRWVVNQFRCLKWNAQNSTVQHQSQEKTAKQFTMATFYWMFEHIQYHSISTTYSIRLAWLRADFPLHTPAETWTMKQLSNNWNKTVQIRLLSWNGFDWSHLGSHQGFSDSFVKEMGPNLMYNPFFVKVLSPRICVLARKQCKHGQARKFKRADRDRNMTFLGTVATVAFETQVQHPLIIFDHLWLSLIHDCGGGVAPARFASSSPSPLDHQQHAPAMVGVKAHNPKLNATRTGRSRQAPLVNAPGLMQVLCIVLMPCIIGYVFDRARLTNITNCNNLNQIIYIYK